MAVKIRLARAGAKKAPFYRVVAADVRAPRDGRFIEILGRYNPRTEPSLIELDLDKIDAWIAKGATPSDTVAKLIAIAKDPSAVAPTRETAPSKKAQAKAAEAEKAAKEPVAEAPAETPAQDEPADEASSEEPAAQEPAEEDAPAETADEAAE